MSKKRGFALGTVLSLFFAFAIPAFASASPVIVQGTTDVRDAGLLEEVIEPGFHAAYPQYEMKYIAVGTGQAIANAKAGQGDALMVHAPSQEKTFVEEGYSLEPRGRAVFYSDYVIPGPLDDPAGVLAKAPHNAVLAYELIAKAGEEGKANFISRGDNSGTNTQEKAIWKLTGVELNEVGEPGPAGTKTDDPWYHKAGAGQAETVKLTAECPEGTFPGGGCYEMTDRGTFNRLVSNGSVTTLQIVSQNNEASAPGGQNLLTNPFTFYAINPAKEPNININVEGAKALMEYLTSEAFQAGLASYPNVTAPAFFADAHPKMTASTVPGTLDPGTKFTVSGSIASLLPGAQVVSGVPVNLQEAPPGQSNYTTIASGTTGADGSYSVQATADHEGQLRVEMPDTNAAWPDLGITPLISSGGLTQTFAGAGLLSVRSTTKPPGSSIANGKVVLRKPQKKGKVVTLRGQLTPAVKPSDAAVLVVQGRKVGTHQKMHALKKVRAREGVAYKVSVKLKPGKWKLRVLYRDPGVISPGTSRAVSVSVR
ncbi:MAG TPA: substrate-binding domain-containing protein [Solirubrobacterales bacterium]|nr:substrate-binding domain-containing protein [Solirubrobacterales bacterium]